MPITPATFTNHKLLNTTRNYRGYADVVLVSPTGAMRSPVFQCLVDTGSDYTVLPVSAATAAGMTVPAGASVKFRTAGGTAFSLPALPAVDLVVEGYAIKVLVAFSSSPSFTPILGRLDLVAAFDFGIDTTNWYFG